MPAPGPRTILAAAAMLAAAALAAAGCGGSSEPATGGGQAETAAVDPAETGSLEGLTRTLEVEMAYGDIARAMLGEIVGDPVALTYAFVELAVADPAMSGAEMRARATELADAGCSDCARIVSDAANSMG